MSEEYWRRMLTQGSKLYGQNVDSIKEILLQNRGWIYEIPQDEYVILLCSGGMDSAVLIDLVVREWNCKVIILYFERNAKNNKWEKQAVNFFFDFYKERYPDNVKELIVLTIEIPSRVNKEFLDQNRKKVMMLPLRNATMWSNAFTQAVYLSGKYETTIRSIIVGSVKEDLSSPESGILAILSQNLHTCISMGIWYYQLMAPFIDGSSGKQFDKLELLKYAEQYDIPIEKSRSCFGADEQPCNNCLACENRNKAYKEFNAMKSNTN